MFCGTSNILLPVANKSQFPVPFRDSSYLVYYASIFNSLEVNRSFYQVPRPATFSRWETEVPEGFRFSVKLWKAITHVKNFAFLHRDVEIALNSFNAIQLKKGGVLLQFPAGINRNHEGSLQNLLETISLHNHGWKIAIEFRDKSWYCDHVYRLLERFGACLVEHDMPHSATQNELPASDTRYIRFHGAAGDYKGSYTEEILERFAQGIHQSEKTGKQVYVYFNNTIGDAFQNALTLLRLYYDP
jgi:uncharacterized protein YecE (DUF72 family)